MKILITSLLLFILSFLFIIHFYWGFGGKTALLSTIPTDQNNKPIIKPGPVDCFIVALGLLAFAVFILIKAGTIPVHLPNWLFNYGLWAISVLFLARAVGDFKYVGIFKKIKMTKFAQMDSKYYSPLCLFLSLLGIILELIS